MRVFKGMVAGLAGGVVLMGAAHNANANSITVTINTPVVTALPDGTYEWAYGATLSAGSEIQQGNFFEIVDFGKVLGVTPDANWSYTTQAHSQVTGSDVQLAFNSLPADTMSRTNVLFQYNGPQIGDAFSPTNLGVFKIISPHAELGNGAIIGNDQQYVSGTGVGRSQTNFGPTAVPVPLPAAAWGGMALIGLLAASRVRKAMR